MENQLEYRARVVAMYQRYCPEKPLSHVDFLMAKYKGFEEELMEVLVEKYGPEPTSTSSVQYPIELGDALGTHHSPQSLGTLLQKFQGMEESLLYEAKASSPLRPQQAARADVQSMLRETDESRAEVFRQRQEQFRRDMNSLSREKQNVNAQSLADSIVEAQSTVQKQEKEIRTLRSDLQAIKVRHEENAVRLDEEMRAVATELTAAKLNLLKLEGQAVPGELPLSYLHATERDIAKTVNDTLEALKLLQVLERIVRTHLALYPVTPMRSRLREIDSALCARLDTL